MTSPKFESWQSDYIQKPMFWSEKKPIMYSSKPTFWTTCYAKVFDYVCGEEECVQVTAIQNYKFMFIYKQVHLGHQYPHQELYHPQEHFRPQVHSHLLEPSHLREPSHLLECTPSPDLTQCHHHLQDISLTGTGSKVDLLLFLAMVTVLHHRDPVSQRLGCTRKGEMEGGSILTHHQP